MRFLMNDVNDSRKVDEHGVSVGPWTYEETPSAEDRSIEAWSVIAADGYVIADVIYREDGPLLAAAHELLTACEGAAIEIGYRDWSITTCRICGQGVAFPGAQWCSEKCRAADKSPSASALLTAAIAKAKAP